MSNILSMQQDASNNLNPEFYENDFETMGFIDAGKVGGSTSAFNISLERFYSRLLLNKDSKQYDIDVKNSEAETRIKLIKEKIETHKNEIDRLQNKELPEAQLILKKANDDLSDFKVNPAKYVKVEKDNLLLWLYGILSLFIAVFLYFFYSSVIYSAVFRDVSISKFTIFDSIFYPKSIEEAYSKGLAALMIVLFSPFIFLALGLAIEHIKTKNSNKYRFTWIGVAIFTFIVDALLAYHISERIYNAKAINSFGNVKPFSIGDAIVDLNFWIIIALGFCVYLLFGYIFSLYTEQRLNKNKFDETERMMKGKVASAFQHIENIKNNIRTLEQEVYSLNISITEIEKEYDKIFYSPNELIKIISDFALGWVKYLQNAKTPESEIQKIEISLNNFYSEKGIK
ncbi:Hypothetical protein IALB_1204 [Ignavibacterium album JCM 16511]|uniref:Beta-carotene 15,15'-monooxygenase n=1 Tax=Ignavibacterium album (strain DSM 19864 / JCM 16511 / NBRC 101810 / Mat9-16) TaxID=945713 RepID=I0AIV8_IGNAJ|nr:hypothetical protein [Ignavibacterium album]AFH48915.1 Hypothetical protein IALB_1204 [Ignavibacterium album JCM 16511]